MHNSKQTIEEVLNERTVKLTKQILCVKGLFDYYDKADEVLKIICLLRDVQLI